MEIVDGESGKGQDWRPLTFELHLVPITLVTWRQRSYVRPLLNKTTINSATAMPNKYRILSRLIMNRIPPPPLKLNHSSKSLSLAQNHSLWRSHIAISKNYTRHSLVPKLAHNHLRLMRTLICTIASYKILINLSDLRSSPVTITIKYENSLAATLYFHL